LFDKNSFHGKSAILYDQLLKIPPGSNAFKAPLMECVENILYSRKEELNIPLLQAMMKISGLNVEYGFSATTANIPCNHLYFQFGEIEIESILDWALWQSRLYYEEGPLSLEFIDLNKLILHATELKLQPTQFDYAQLVGQSLCHASYNRGLSTDSPTEMTAYSLALSGWIVRFMTFRCSVAYLDGLKEGKVLRDQKPIIMLSKPYDLLRLQHRNTVIGALKARKNILRISSTNQ